MPAPNTALPHSTLPPDIAEAAAGWIARRDAGLSPQEERELAVWRNADPRHDAALTRLDRVWATLDRPLATGTADAVLGELEARATRRKRRGAWAAGLAVLLIAAGIGWRARLPAPELPARQNATATVLLPRIQALADGSQAELRDGAEITVAFSAQERRIVLGSGQAYFQVAKDPLRPFVVVAGGVAVRAVGTEFSVDLAPDAVEVLVTEGKVAVVAPAAQPAAPEGRAAEPLVVGAGEGAVVRLDAPAGQPRVNALPHVDLSAQLGWRGLRLEFSGTPLIEAVALLNRHNQVQFVIEDPELARMKVSGIFGAANTESFVRLLALSFPVAAERRGDREIRLHRKRGP